MLQLLELLYINARRFSYLSTDQLLNSSSQKVAIPKNCEIQPYHNSYVTHLYLWISRRTFSTLGIQGFRINNFKVNGKSYYFVLCLRYIKSRLTVFGLKTKCLQLSLELSAFVVLSIIETYYPCIKTLKDEDGAKLFGLYQGYHQKKILDKYS